MMTMWISIEYLFVTFQLRRSLLSSEDMMAATHVTESPLVGGELLQILPYQWETAAGEQNIDPSLPSPSLTPTDSQPIT